jgi:hypothetical protein
MTVSDERRWFAVGDAQTTFARFMQVLARHGVLGPDGRVAENVGLVAVGDYFDYGIVDDTNVVEVGREGTTILKWLASHSPEQVVILFGNHDLARVMELAFETDAGFRAAQHKARAVIADPTTRAAFFAEHPRIPTPEVALRDFSSFCVEQRELVQDLLLQSRARLAVVARRHGRDVLISHAGVTLADLKACGSHATDAAAIADDLDAFLERAVENVRPLWSSDALAPLDLSPLCVAGVSDAEGGGLVFHRPSDPARPAITDVAWETNPERVRRFDPHILVPGVTQACGHTSHQRCIKEMPRWTDAATAAERAGHIRLLQVSGDEVTYRIGVTPQATTALYLIDGDMNRVAVGDYEILPLDGVTI